MTETNSKLKRPRHPMPDFVRAALEAERLVAVFQSRPPYQQNDYIGWISRAKLPATQAKRLSQMLEELHHGGLYMKMAYHPKKVAK